MYTTCIIKMIMSKREWVVSCVLLMLMPNATCMEGLMCNSSGLVDQSCYTCSLQGLRACTDNSIISSEGIGELDECLSICKKNKSCLGFHYDYNRQTCMYLIKCVYLYPAKESGYLYRKTCNTDCPHFTLHAFHRHRIECSDTLTIVNTSLDGCALICADMKGCRYVTHKDTTTCFLHTCTRFRSFTDGSVRGYSIRCFTPSTTTKSTTATTTTMETTTVEASSNIKPSSPKTSLKISYPTFTEATGTPPLISTTNAENTVSVISTITESVISTVTKTAIPSTDSTRNGTEFKFAANTRQTAFLNTDETSVLSSTVSLLNTKLTTSKCYDSGSVHYVQNMQAFMLVFTVCLLAMSLWH